MVQLVGALTKATSMCGVQVVDVMKDNIGKVIERGERLDNIEERSGTYVICLSKRKWTVGGGVGWGVGTRYRDSRWKSWMQRHC